MGWFGLCWNCSSRGQVRLAESRQASTSREAELPAQILELDAQRELEIALALAGAAAAFGEHFAKRGGVGRVQADICSAAATAIAAPIRMIPDVVRFGTELEAEVLVDGNSLEQAHVPILVPRL